MLYKTEGRRGYTPEILPWSISRNILLIQCHVAKLKPTQGPLELATLCGIWIWGCLDGGVHNIKPYPCVQSMDFKGVKDGVKNNHGRREFHCIGIKLVFYRPPYELDHRWISCISRAKPGLQFSDGANTQHLLQRRFEAFSMILASRASKGYLCFLMLWILQILFFQNKTRTRWVFGFVLEIHVIRKCVAPIMIAAIKINTKVANSGTISRTSCNLWWIRPRFCRRSDQTTTLQTISDLCEDSDLCNSKSAWQ